MNRKNLYCFSGLVVMLATITGCGLSGPAVPTVDSSARGTALAATALSFGTATFTPAPTETPIPTPKISVYGTSLIINADQSATFIDHKAGIQLTIPAGWLPIRVNEDEFYKAYSLDVVVQNPAIADRLTTTQSANLDFHRLDAIDIRDGHIPNGIITVINVVFQENDRRSLEDLYKAESRRKKPFFGYKFITANYPYLDDGTRVLQIEEKWDGETGVIYYRGVFFSLPSGAFALDFYTDMDFKDTVLPDFEQVIKSLTLLNP